MSTLKKMMMGILALVLCLSLSVNGVSAAATPAKVTGFSIYNIQDSVLGLKWKAAKNAKKYQIYYKKSSAKSWKSKTITKKTFTNNGKKVFVKSLTPNTKYKVKVRAVNGKKYGKWSTTKSATTYKQPKAPTRLYTVYKNHSSLTIGWNKSATSGVKGYEISLIELKQSEKTYTYTLQGTQELSYALPYRLYPNTWCMVKVRSYKRYSKGTAYSKWATYYTSTTRKGQVIEYKGDQEYGDGARNYEMTEGTFTIGSDDSLIPAGYGVTEESHDEGAYVEYYYNPDYLYVDKVVIPNDVTLSDGEENEITGKTLTKDSGGITDLYLSCVTEDESEYYKGDKKLHIVGGSYQGVYYW